MKHLKVALAIVLVLASISAIAFADCAGSANWSWFSSDGWHRVNGNCNCVLCRGKDKKPCATAQCEPCATNAPTEPETCPTEASTEIPTLCPTEPETCPTEASTEIPTLCPTEPETCPTAIPTEIPTLRPTAAPTEIPTLRPTAAPTKAPTTHAPTSRPTATPPTSSGETSTDLAQQVLNILNGDRANAGLAPLSMDAELTRAACVRSREIVTKFSHTRPDGSSCFTVSSKALAENIAKGQRSAARVCAAWMSSSGHRRNILNANYSVTGICAYEYNGVIYWTQLFGR